mgnify:FL=1
MPGATERIQLKAAVKPGHAGMRLDQVAAELFGDYSRARLQKRIRAGDLTLDGEPQKPTHRVLGGEVLRLDAAPELSEAVLPQPIPLDFVYADDDIFVVE